MNRITFLRSKRIYKIDQFLKEKFAGNFDFNILELPADIYFTQVVNPMATICLESIYPGYGIDWVILDYAKSGNESRWFINREEYSRRGEKIIKDEDFIRKVIRDYKKAAKNFYCFIEKLEKYGIDEKKIQQDYLKFLELYIKEYAIAYSVTGPMALGYGDTLMAKIFKKYNYSSQVRQAIDIYTQSKSSFLAEEERNLRRIANLMSRQNIKLMSISQLKKKYFTIYQNIVKHQKRYYWINNNYKYVEYLSADYFFQRIRRMNKTPKDAIKNKVKIKQYKMPDLIDKRDLLLLKRLGLIAALHDERKKANLIANYWLDQFLKVTSKIYQLNYSFLKIASYREIAELLSDKILDLEKIKKRRGGCLIINFKKNREYWLTNQDYKIFNNLLSSARAQIKIKRDISGLSANPGKAEGKAKIVFDVRKEGSKIKNGDILIASMTRPEFAPFLKKVKAIVTNEGGITSHAAIISRELNIPCIVGTKNATDLLKDGDLVEVDANRGIVKILK